MTWDRENWLEELRSQPIPPEGVSFLHARFTPDSWYFNAADYKGEAEIVVSCTQQEGQAKLVRGWAEALPSMTGLRKIEFCTRFPNELVSPVSRMTWLESLHIKWSGLKSIAPWRDLVNLNEFNLGSSPSLADPETVLLWPNLQRLAFENVRSIYDIEWISDLKGLNQLNLAGSMWTDQKLLSLRPISKLNGLERLVIIGARVRDKESLFELAKLKSLKSLLTALWWPKGSLERLSELRKDLYINGMKWPNFERDV